MDALILLPILLVLAIPVSIGILLFANHRRSREIADLRRDLARNADAIARLERKLAAHGPAPGAVPDGGAGIAAKAQPEGGAETPAGPWERAAEQRTAATATTHAPEPTGRTPASAPAQAPGRGAYVFRAETARAAGEWLRGNWFLAVAAVSLALAAVFLVQFGVERGLVTPTWRVLGAAALGVALIWGGEFVRRRWGDPRRGDLAYLPSTFSGAGIVALFVAVLAGEHLYGMIGPGQALVWLVLIAAVAVALGWFYGPFLAGFGIVGAVAAPFVIGGSSDEPHLFFYYLAAVALAGLAIDAVRRWAWVTVIALIGAHVGAYVIHTAAAGDAHYLAFSLILAVGAIIVPPLSLVPRHDGGPVYLDILPAARGGVARSFPARAAAGGFLAAVAVALVVVHADRGGAEVWLALTCLALLYLAAAIWMRQASALSALVLAPPAAFLAALQWQASTGGSLAEAFWAYDPATPESTPPAIVSVLVAMALGASLVAAWRGWSDAPLRSAWAAGAALFAPLTVVLLEISWLPSETMGAARWSSHAMAVAAAMVLCAERFARLDGPSHRRVAWFALSALTMIAFALSLLLSGAALTLSLAFMAVAAAAFDRWLNLRPLMAFVIAGVAVVYWRLAIDPGLDWSFDAAFGGVALAHLGVIGLLAAAWGMLAARHRRGAQAVVEVAALSVAALFLSVSAGRFLDDTLPPHALAGIIGSIWLSAAALQLRWWLAGGAWRRFRVAAAILTAIATAVLLALVWTVLNPLASFDPIAGIWPLDSLLLAYLLPGALFAAAVRLVPLHGRLRLAGWALAGLHGVFYTALEIRRAFQGPVLARPGVSDGELYSYSAAMLILSALLLLAAVVQQSRGLRRAAMIGIGLTIAKVFLVDMAGLTGLLRVTAFLGLGLSLAVLAWVDRRLARHLDGAGGAPS